MRRPAVLAAAICFSVFGGTYGCSLKPAAFQAVHRSPEKINCFAFHRGKIWIGTAEGLSAIPRGGGKAVLYGADAGLAGRQLNVLGILPHGDRLLLATSAGVADFSIPNGHVKRTWTSSDGLGHDSVRDLFPSGRDIWAATIFGAGRFDRGSGRWKTYSESEGFPKRHVFTFASDGKTLWASSINGGLVRFSPADDGWKAVSQQKGLGNTHIYDIEPGAGGLWLGTAAGINFYSTQTGKWDERICADGFTDYCVYAVKLAGDTLWFGTSFGLYRRSLKSGEQALYTCKDGLPGNEVVGISVEDQELWVCTRKGIAKLKEKPGS